MKTCAKCKEDLPLDSFYRSSQHKDGRQSYCKPCRAAYTKAWRPKGYDRQATKNRDLSRKYGITLEEYEGLAFSQDWKCAVCGAKPEKDLYVDHNHHTGEIRGLLCSPCNLGLGHLQDSTAVLRGAIEYLEENGSYGH